MSLAYILYYDYLHCYIRYQKVTIICGHTKFVFSSSNALNIKYFNVELLLHG